MNMWKHIFLTALMGAVAGRRTERADLELLRH